MERGYSLDSMEAFRCVKGFHKPAPRLAAMSMPVLAETFAAHIVVLVRLHQPPSHGDRNLQV